MCNNNPQIIQPQWGDELRPMPVTIHEERHVEWTIQAQNALGLWHRAGMLL